MRFPDSNRVLGLLAITCLASSVAAAQDPVDIEADVALDRLIDELWDAPEPLGAVAGRIEANVLELSLEAARAIGLTNDLPLQGAQELVEAARFREVGSWGTFEWLFNASGSISGDKAGDWVLLAGEVETDVQGFSLGFDRAFTSGGSLSLNFSHSNTRTSGGFFQLPDVVNQDVLTAVYTRPLMRGSGEEYTTSLQKIADLRWMREQEAFRLARQELVVRIETCYWDLVLAEQQLGVAGSALDLALEQLDRDRRRREAGVATEVEVIQDEATVARRIEGVLFAETSLRSEMDLLRSILFPGTDSATWSVQLKAITPLPGVSAGPVAGAWGSEIDSALRRRGEVRMSVIDVDLAELAHERTVSEKRPLLDLLFQLSSQGYDPTVETSLEETLSYEFPSVSAGLSLQLPMRNIALENEERATRAELRGARIQLDAQRSAVAADLREALRQVNYQLEAARAATKSREAAERLMKAEQARYEQGLATNFQVLEFQQALVEAQYAERAARAGYGQARAILSGARGLAGEIRGVDAP